MAQQTAVEWLQEQLNPDMKTMQGHIIQDLLEQAKQMEKRHITDAHIEGQRVFDKHPYTQWTNDQAEQYYNETYNK